VDRGLLLWLDASDPSTIQTDANGKVQAWLDKSGNNYHATQTDEARRPLPNATALNGRPAIRFDGGADGAADGLVIDDNLNLTGRPYTIFIVDQYYGTPRGRTLQGRDANWLLGKWSGNNGFFAGSWVAYTGTTDNVPAISDGQAHAYGSGYTLNGIDITGTNGSDTPTGNPGKLALNASGLYNEPSKSDVAEVLVFNRALSFHERSQVGLYLREKYGLTGYTGYNTRLATKEWVFYGADPGEGLDFQGQFRYAVNVGGSGGIQVGDAQFTTDTGLITAEYQIPTFTTPNYGATSNDNNLETIMQSIRWTQTGNDGIEDITITLPGLEIGRTYKLQLLVGDNWNNRHFAVDINGSRVVADLPSAGIQGGTTTQGTVLVHQFVADRSTMTIVLDGRVVTGGDRNPMINAFTLEDLGVTGRTTVSTFTGGDPGEGLDFQGAIIYAVNIGGPGGLRIGDAYFTADTATPGLRINAENHAPNWSSPNYGSSPNDDVLETLMQSARWTETSTNPVGRYSRGEAVSLELAGLVPGQEYVLQLLFGNTGTGRGFDVVINDTLVLDNFSPAAYGASDSVGVVVTHRFEATSSLLSIVLDGYPMSVQSPFSLPHPVLFALTLEAVPEPSSWALLAIGLLSLAAMVRWKRRR
ncbi:MAG: PEP-CTERM sorting domain-containing protein, partial [Thermoguttaceae bacterium]|nr:PEP-CTERM sorting domain-containing protein [Thermoguttaceae bacterium]MDW8038191.1 PEP-CTERM sorting domain-containing protein [Thermoguttaceae bacterium]